MFLIIHKLNTNSSSIKTNTVLLNLLKNDSPKCVLHSNDRTGIGPEYKN